MTSLNMRHILIAEDDPRDLELTLSALQENNLANSIFVVRDGAEALDYLCCRGEFAARAQLNPVAVLLDLKMPKVNGLEVLRHIKSDPNLMSIPVVMLTSSREEPDLVECYKHGVNAYVVKPVHFSEFMRAVRQLGVFWAAVNEPPPDVGNGQQAGPGGKVVFMQNQEASHEIINSNSAFGG